MASRSSIEWTEYTWNPVTGCTKISPGCRNCYAERMAMRLQAMGQPNYLHGFKVTLHEHVLEVPFGWRRPAIVFVNSMSDLFHEEVPLDFIRRVFDVMRRSPHHQYQILTKRAERLADMSAELAWPDNVWMGVSIESHSYTCRIDRLRETGARVKFLSIEPLLGPIPHVNLEGINWVIVGGESGPRARPMKSEWVTRMRDQCVEANVPFFFKQWGGYSKKKAGRKLEGRTWNQMPQVIPVSGHG
ncbi:MAG: phage Gp37/Gp68 family protein [Chloroflexi bacterium]|nr:phage Gp37/Gp68 family protein [Chloroflexota bacterium]